MNKRWFKFRVRLGDRVWENTPDRMGQLFDVERAALERDIASPVWGDEFEFAVVLESEGGHRAEGPFVNEETARQMAEVLGGVPVRRRKTTIYTPWEVVDGE